MEGKYYLVTFFFTMNGSIMYGNAAIHQDPITWLCKSIEKNPDSNVVLINTMEITEEQFSRLILISKTMEVANGNKKDH